MSNAHYKIIQIMPADGWAAVYNEGDKIKYWPLTCWALVERPDGFRVIRGVSCDGKNNQVASSVFEPYLFPEDDNDFIGYKKFQTDGAAYGLDWEYANKDSAGNLHPSCYKRLV